ncbi:Mbov_0396 family ICE element transmembrane protein [Metamycoplasma hyosynoviae]|uniref:Mbov_0396 family ICE element transmembrane protein n=1 Tax=Metamycoplasma hyosynoviae TaxID=29559 RepID=UPI003B632F30
MGALTAVLGPIGYLVFSALWGIFISVPFLILSGLFSAAKFFGFDLINMILFQTKPGEASFKFSNLPIVFFGFAIWAISFGIIFILISFIKYVILNKNKTIAEKYKFKEVLRRSINAFLWTLLLPIAMFILNIIMAIIYSQFEELITLQNGNKTDLASFIYTKINNNEAFATTGTFVPPTFSLYMKWTFTPSGVIKKAAIFVKNLIVGILLVKLLLAILIDIVKNSLLNFSLLILSPLVAAKSIDDNGKALIVWKQKFSQSMVGIFVNLLSLQFFAIFCFMLAPLKTRFVNQNQILIDIVDLVLYIGAAFTIKIMSHYISDFLGINISNIGTKTIKSLTSKATDGISKGITAASAVATGGATAATTIAKGGMANFLGGIAGKAMNAYSVASNKGIASNLGMSSDFIKKGFALAGKNQIANQKDMLGSIKTLSIIPGTNKVNKLATDNLNSLRIFGEQKIKAFDGYAKNANTELKNLKKENFENETEFNNKQTELNNKILFWKSQKLKNVDALKNINNLFTKPKS